MIHVIPHQHLDHRHHSNSLSDALNFKVTSKPSVSQNYTSFVCFVSSNISHLNFFYTDTGSLSNI